MTPAAIIVSAPPPQQQEEQNKAAATSRSSEEEPPRPSNAQEKSYGRHCDEVDDEIMRSPSYGSGVVMAAKGGYPEYESNIGESAATTTNGEKTSHSHANHQFYVPPKGEETTQHSKSESPEEPNTHLFIQYYQQKENSSSSNSLVQLSPQPPLLEGEKENDSVDASLHDARRDDDDEVSTTAVEFPTISSPRKKNDGGEMIAPDPDSPSSSFLPPEKALVTLSSMSPSVPVMINREELPSTPPLLHQHHYYHLQNNNNDNMTNVISSPSRITYAAPPGRRSIKLRLLEEVPTSPSPHSLIRKNLKTPFQRIRSLSLSRVSYYSSDHENKNMEKDRIAELSSPSSSLQQHVNTAATNLVNIIDRGTITVSWYDGTTSSEMQEHVFGCVLRKLNHGRESNASKLKLEDVRLLDENVEPHEEVVLCPFLPDGSQFLLKFRTVEDKSARTALAGTNINNPFLSRAPDSPSAEFSPYPSNVNLAALAGMSSLHPQQVQLLNAAAALLRPPPLTLNSAAAAAATVASSSAPQAAAGVSSSAKVQLPPVIPNDFPDRDESKNGTESSTKAEEKTDDLIEQQLRQLKELFLQRRASHFTKSNAERNEEKKQVIFLIGNYLVLFMSLIALSAEIQSRLPQMMKWVQKNYDSVQNCATDRDALVDCLSNGDLSGLIASFLLWATQSVAAKRIFLFGFDTPKKLWTVVYEAFVSAVCWGISYLFIRRGLNPNTRQNFVHNYWKDAVYGSLAGFNAAFLKAVLKNLVPQDVALEALQEGRQLKIFNWLGSLLADE